MDSLNLSLLNPQNSAAYAGLKGPTAKGKNVSTEEGGFEAAMIQMGNALAAQGNSQGSVNALSSNVDLSQAGQAEALSEIMREQGSAEQASQLLSQGSLQTSASQSKQLFSGMPEKMVSKLSEQSGQLEQPDQSGQINLASLDSQSERTGLVTSGTQPGMMSRTDQAALDQVGSPANSRDLGEMVGLEALMLNQQSQVSGAPGVQLNQGLNLKDDSEMPRRSLGAQALVGDEASQSLANSQEVFPGTNANLNSAGRLEKPSANRALKGESQVGDFQSLTGQLNSANSGEPLSAKAAAQSLGSRKALKTNDFFDKRGGEISNSNQVGVTGGNALRAGNQIDQDQVLQKQMASMGGIIESQSFSLGQNDQVESQMGGELGAQKLLAGNEGRKASQNWSSQLSGDQFLDTLKQVQSNVPQGQNRVILNSAGNPETALERLERVTGPRDSASSVLDTKGSFSALTAPGQLSGQTVGGGIGANVRQIKPQTGIVGATAGGDQASGEAALLGSGIASQSMSQGLGKASSQTKPAQEMTAQVTTGSMAKPRLATDGLASLTTNVGKMAESGGGEIRIRLKPDNLGEVHVHVKTVGNQVGLQIQASSEESKRILEGSLSALKESLSSQHLNIGKLEITLASSASGANLGQSMNQSGSGNQESQSFANQNFASDLLNQSQSQGFGSEERTGQGNSRSDSAEVPVMLSRGRGQFGTAAAGSSPARAGGGRVDIRI